MKNKSYYEKKSVKDVFKELNSSPKGLNEEDAKKRLEKYGSNEIKQKEETFFKRALRRFYGPIPIMIEIAAALSVFVGKWDDFWIILFLLFSNAIIDIWQENKALNALNVLKNKLAKKALVLRDGKFKEMDAKNLVSGDIIKIKIGDIVPADIKLIELEDFLSDQSSLTGESLPVSKKIGSIVYENSIVKKGEAVGVVINTGSNTYFGKTVSLVAKAQKEEKSHLEKAVVKIGKYLIAITIFLVVLIFIVSLLRHQSFISILRYALILTIASIPVAMPAILSITLAVGALTLSKKHAIVSKLASIEELAGIDTLCFDKTGTLTQNRMSIDTPVIFGRYPIKDLMLYAALASNEEEKDPIEIPIFEYLKEKKLYDELKSFTRLKFKPFNPVDKRTETTIKQGIQTFTVTKGAVQVIMDLTHPHEAKKIQKTVDDFSQKGMRTLAVAIKRSTRYEFVGIIPLLDLPRQDTKKIIKESKALGLNLKMLTGDNLSIARYISSLVGIGKKVFNFSGIKSKIKIVNGKTQNFSISSLNQIKNANGFAQVYPEDKYTIVESLQKSGHLVGMTGDGVNDAPALKKADGGIAVSGATDAARASANLILMDKGLSVIIDAIKEARKIFLRMKSYSTYRIAETIRLIFFITASIVILEFYPITPIMIILLLIFNDLPILAIAYDNTLIENKPVRWNLKEVLTVSTVLGTLGVIASFGALYFAKDIFGLSFALVQTVIFLKLAVAGHSTIYVARIKKRFWQKPYPSKILLIAGLGTEVVATLFAVYGWFISPIGWAYAGLIWAYAIVWFLINDEAKVLTYKYLKKKKREKGDLIK